MLLGDPRQSDQRTQSFHFPIVIHQSLDPAARSSAQAPISLSSHALRALDRLRLSDSRRGRWKKKLHQLLVQFFFHRPLTPVRTRRLVGSTRRRGNHMHDHSRFQSDINDFTGVSLSLSLSLSLSYSQKSLTHNIGSASALPIIKSYNRHAEFNTGWLRYFLSKLWSKSNWQKSMATFRDSSKITLRKPFATLSLAWAVAADLTWRVYVRSPAQPQPQILIL